MTLLHDILLHREFLDQINELAPEKSKLRRLVNEKLLEVSQNPRGSQFNRLWTFPYHPYEITTWRAHVGGSNGNRLIYGLFQHTEQRRVEIVPLLLSKERKDEGFTYERKHKQIRRLIIAIADEYFEQGRDCFSPWEGTL